MKTAVISITQQGNAIAESLKALMDIDIYSKQHNEDFDIRKLCKKLMEEYNALIFISSTGIAVRSIAAYLRGKDVDPAVIVIDNSGRFVISLLSGHLGGANEFTEKIAKFINAEPIITTATDALGITAPDMIAKEHSLIIEDLKKAKKIAAMLVEGKTVAFNDENHLVSLPKGYTDRADVAEGLVYVTNKASLKLKESDLKSGNREKLYENFSPDKSLKLIRKNIILGIGCRKDFDAEKMIEQVIKVLCELNLDARAVKYISTIELKKEEKAILELSKYLNCELRVYSSEEISSLQYKYEGSDFVEKTVGVRAVCEPCVELCGGRLLTSKLKLCGMTLCIGEC